MENKEQIVRLYSNPEQVYKNSLKYFKKHIPIYFSTRRNKKYMIFDEKNNKWVHFGIMNPPMEDYTKHQDEERRRLFKLRNARWKDAPKYSASALSYYLLW